MTTTPSVPPGWRVLAHGAGFVEGPVALDGAVAFVAVNRGQVARTALDGSGTTVLAETGGGPNGATADSSGRIWVVQNGGRVMTSTSERPSRPGIQVIAADGTVTAALEDDDLHAPNDCAFGPDGRVWFTDPYGRLMADPPGDPDRSGAHGRVWAWAPATGDLELIADRLPHPNGLCFTADGERLLISDTRTAAILVVDVAGSGPRAPKEHARLPDGKPDGMAFDRAGRLWVAATSSEGLGVLAPDGGWEHVALGDSFPTNVCFAGPELDTIVVTAARGGRVLASSAAVPGLPLHLGD